MKYVPPVGGTADQSYVDGDPATGVEGSLVPAAAIEHPMRELEALIVAAGLSPSASDLTQIPSAVRVLQQGMLSSAAVASGSADAITASFSPAITTLTNGMTLRVRAASANTTTTPTFTPNSGSIAAKTIVKRGDTALIAGDIAGAGHWLELCYDTTLGKWALLNPANGVNAVSAKQIQSISAVVSSNALTLGLNPTSLDFRAAALASGVPNTRTIASALSLTVPSGATLGTVAATAARLALLAIDNSGTVELAIANLSGGVNLDETTLISTTAISASATSASAIYSATARTSVPFRVVGVIDITEATAGTWATAPTLVQGCGGQALAALASLGFGQTWQAPARVSGTTYYNTTGKSITLFYNCPSGSNATIVVGGVYFNVPASYINTTVIIPPGAAYSVTVGAGSLGTWNELR